jgi:hypothetical protein
MATLGKPDEILSEVGSDTTTDSRTGSLAVTDTGFAEDADLGVFGVFGRTVICPDKASGRVVGGSPHSLRERSRCSHALLR